MPGTQYDVDIAIAVRNLQTLDRLANRLNKLKDLQGIPPSVRQGVEALGTALDKYQTKVTGAGAAGKKASEDNTRAQDAALRLEQAYARLQVASGNLQGAQRTLANALATATKESVTHYNAKRQLVDVESKLANETSKGETALLLRARTLARIAQIAGDTKGAIEILEQALSGVNPNSLAAARAQLQLTYLNTQYANSPLIGAIRGTTNALQALLPMTGRAGAGLAQLAAQGGNVAGAFAGVVSSGAAVAGIATGIGIVIAAVTALTAAVKVAELGFSALTGTIDTLTSVAREGLEVNNELAKTTIAIASVIQASGELKINGQAVESAQQFAVALGIAEQQVKALRTEAIALGLNVSEVVEGYKVGLAPLARQKVSLEDSRRIILGVTAAAKSQGLAMSQIGQELRAILNGESRRSDLLNQILNISKQDIATARERGEVATLLLDKLQPFIAGGEQFARTFEGGLARGTAALKIFEAEITTGLSSAINEAIQDGLKALNGQTLAQRLPAITQVLTQIFDSAGVRGAQVIDGIINLVLKLEAILDTNRVQVAAIVEIFFQMFDLAGLIVDTFFDLVGDSKDVQQEIQVIRSIMTAVYAVVLGTVTLFRLFGAAAAGVGGAIAAGLLVPLAAFAQALASFLKFVPTIGDGVQSAANAVSRAASEAIALTGRAAIAGATAVKDIFAQTAKFNAGVEEAEKRADQRRRLRRVEEARPVPTGTTFTGRTLTDEDKNKEKNAKALKSAQDARIQAENDLRNALLKLQEAFYARELSLAKSSLELENQILDRQLEDRQISYEDYYREKIDAQQRATRLELDAIQQTIAAEREKIAQSEQNEKRRLANAAGLKISDAELIKRELSVIQNFSAARVANDAKLTAKLGEIRAEEAKDRATINAKLVELDGKLIEAEQKGAAEEAALLRRKIQQYRDANKEAQDLKVDILRLQGQTLEADVTEIKAKYKELQEVVIQFFGATSQEASNVVKARAAELGEAARSELERVSELIQRTLDLQRGDIDLQVRRGLIGEIEARQRILQIEREKRDELLRQLAIQEQLVKVALKPGVERDLALTDIARRRQDAEGLGVDSIFEDIRAGIENDLARPFSDFFRNAKLSLDSLRDLAGGLIQSIRNATARLLERFIEEKVIKPLSDKVFNFLTGGDLQAKPPDPSVERNTASTDANTLALQNLIVALQNLGILPGGGSFNFPVTVPDGFGGAGGATADVLEEAELLTYDVPNKIKAGLGNINTQLTLFGSGLTVAGAAIGGKLGTILSIVGTVLNVISALGGFGGAKAPRGGFAGGGYTGDLLAHEIAGFVHGREMVFSAKETSFYGLPFLNALRSAAHTPGTSRGFMSGGYSGGSLPTSDGFFQRAQASPFAATRNAPPAGEGARFTVVNVATDEDAYETAEASRARGDEVWVNKALKNRNIVRRLYFGS